MAVPHFICGRLTWVKCKVSPASPLFLNYNFTASFHSPIADDLPGLNPITTNITAEKFFLKVEKNIKKPFILVADFIFIFHRADGPGLLTVSGKLGSFC